ncbi:MAG: CPBP family intramembrane glutamic endopeptidase [Gemmatimonadales bacterium]
MPNPRRTILVAAVLFEGGLLLAAWVGGRLTGHPPFSGAVVTLPAVAWGVAATLPPLLALGGLTRCRWPPLRRLLDSVDAAVTPLFVRCTLVQLAVIAAVAGLGEEALFRGLIQGGAVEWLGDAGGLLAASALFGLAHLVTPVYAILAGIMGLYLGVLQLWSGNLVVPIVAHAVYDLGALLYLVRGRSGTP